jgi:hypothetical protein
VSKLLAAICISIGTSSFGKKVTEYPKTTMKTRGYVKILIINMEGKI